MRWTVTSAPEALEQLSDLWVVTADWAEMTRVHNFMEGRLARQPEQCGVEIAEGLRVWEHGPLRIYFEISVPDCIVKVTKVTKPIS